jgi:hypothetical protein
MNRLKRPAEIAEGELLTEGQAVEYLGISRNRVRWLLISGHLHRGVTSDGRGGGIAKDSVEDEQAWRSRATTMNRLRRVLSYAFTWMP